MLISNIKTTATEFGTANEDYELMDNELQKVWTLIMKPKKSLLKFQCSKTNKNNIKSFSIF